MGSFFALLRANRQFASGVVLLAVALLSASWCVVRLVFGSTAADLVAIGGVALLLVLWLLLPRTFRVHGR